MAEVTICDIEDCGDEAEFHVKILRGDWSGLEFDLCALTDHSVWRYIGEANANVQQLQGAEG